MHICKAYWAPLTKGSVGLLDVMSFLITGGLYGIRIGTKQFKWWLFGGYLGYAAPIRTVAYLLLALLVVVSLVVVNAVAAAVVAARLPVHTLPPCVTPMLFQNLTTILNVVVTVAALFVMALLVTKWTRGITLVHGMSSAATVGAFVVAILTAIAAGVAVPVVTYVHVRDHPPAWAETLLPLLPSIGFWGSARYHLARWNGSSTGLPSSATPCSELALHFCSSFTHLKNG